jgi:hypothetical protein
MSGIIKTLFFAEILCASNDIGPFAASIINFVLISAAFFEVITFSLAAGIRTSHFLFSKRLPSLTKLPLG